MPELPEAETIARGLRRYLVGKKILQITARVPSLRRPLNLIKLRTGAVGKKVVAVNRRGKAIIIELSGKRAILIQLGMTGACKLCPEQEALNKHDHVIFAVSGKLSLRFEDIRRFGMLESFQLDEEASWPEFLKTLGPEPLEKGFSGEYLHTITRKRKTAIKTLLLNQRSVAGIGNIYASELLFRAHIRPGRAAGRLKLAECEKIVEQTRKVLKEAIKAGGTTISDYKGVDGNAGKFDRKLRIYGKAGKACEACGGTIKRIVQTGRATFYCPVCQK
ncbi:MAG: bifunctional DNA-formamidopyrimidine glycosylase/DNA-(apurinic or apyrimidinic site) lyase [Planctomycetes bacterium]|nr:bifunctional DNA-formamidopyrimidine glycosylase/DNA-(apurinic or apyrimidinic site) lyase [Planctomycetota bacterium]